MAYGNGVNWNGTAPVNATVEVTVQWRTPLELLLPADAVSFDIGPPSTTTAASVAHKLKTAWNGAGSGQADLDPHDPTIVRFTRAGHSVARMCVQVGSGDLLELKEGPCNQGKCTAVAVVTGLTVINVP